VGDKNGGLFFGGFEAIDWRLLEYRFEVGFIEGRGFLIDE
jgi:hypothetical protein